MVLIHPSKRVNRSPGTADGGRVTTDRCIKCMAPVAAEDGYENSVGEAMCTECHAELWQTRFVAPAPTIEEWALNALEKARNSLGSDRRTLA